MLESKIRTISHDNEICIVQHFSFCSSMIFHILRTQFEPLQKINQHSWKMIIWLKKVKMKRVSNDNILPNYLIVVEKKLVIVQILFRSISLVDCKKNNKEKYFKADASLYCSISSSSLISDDPWIKISHI